MRVSLPLNTNPYKKETLKKAVKTPKIIFAANRIHPSTPVIL